MTTRPPGRFLTPNVCAMHLVPAGRTRAQSVALMVATHHKIFYDEFENVVAVCHGTVLFQAQSAI